MITINGIQVKPTIFPDKTSQVWKLPDNALADCGLPIVWEFEQEAELIWLAQLAELLSVEWGHRPGLLIDYLPYGRQDKSVSNDTTFALTTFARMLWALPFGKIEIVDPHSHALFLNAPSTKDVRARYPINAISASFASCGADIVCYPDGGAWGKYSDILIFDSVSASKQRDQLTGAITGLKLEGDVQGKRVLIVDDICDGGATFVGLADALLKAGATFVGLYVSHGLFTRGTKVLFDAGIGRIFTKEGEVSHVY